MRHILISCRIFTQSWSYHVRPVCKSFLLAEASKEIRREDIPENLLSACHPKAWYGLNVAEQARCKLAKNFASFQIALHRMQSESSL